MTSIASLGIRVTTQGVSEAERGLDKLSQAGAKVEQQTARTAKGMQQTAISAKQLQAATRNLPAQFTDIATSLGSGQRPLQVLLQQGGQIKDMFGGIGPAIRAMGGYVVGLINPVTLLAAGVGILGAAWYQATDRAEQFNKALIFTGNYAAASADELGRLAEKLDDTTSATQGRASEVLAQIAATGRFTADQLEMVTRAALLMEDATGQAIEETIKQFVALQGDPVDAILKLNDTQHFLTQATLDQIESLKKQGREADAAAVAMRAYADTIEQRAPQAVENLGLLAGAWRVVKKDSAEAWDTIVNGFQRADVAAKQGLRSISDYMQVLRLPGGASAFAFAGVQAGGSFSSTSTPARGANGKPAESAAEHKARMDAEREFASLALSNLSKRERLEAEIAKIKKLGIDAGKSDLEIQKQIANARARYAEGLPKGPKARKARGQSDASIQSARDRFDDMVGRFQAELDGPLQRVEQNHIKNMRELEQTAKAGKISHDQLAAALATEAKAYAKSSEEVRNRLDAEVASLSGPVAQAQNDHEDALRRIEELKQQGAATGAQYNAMLAQEAKTFRQAAMAAERAADPIGTLIEDMRFQLEVMGKTNTEQAIANELRREGIDLSSAYGQAMLAEARSIGEAGDALERHIDLMDDFRSGASNALSDFVTGAKSAKDALKDFFDEMAAQIAKAIANKWMQQLFGQQGTSQTGSAGGGIWDMIGGLFGSFLGGASAGGRAIGGPVSAGRMYEVNERGAPEMYEANGRQYLMAPADGRVVPLRQGGGGRGGVVQNISFMVEGRIDRSTQSQVAARAYGAASRASARNR